MIGPSSSVLPGLTGSGYLEYQTDILSHSYLGNEPGASEYKAGALPLESHTVMQTLVHSICPFLNLQPSLSWSQNVLPAFHNNSVKIVQY